MFSNGLGINSNDARNRMHSCIRLLYRIGSGYSEAIRMKINYPKVAEHLGVRLRGNETFDELLKIEQQVKEHKKKITEYYYPKNKDGFMGSENRKTRTRYETDEEQRQRIAEQNANIQRVDAQVKKYWK